MDNRYDQGRYNTQGLNPYDYSNLGLTILYLVVIVGGVVGNGLFSYVVIKNRNLHRSAHFLLASLAVRDVVVAISVVPFVIDSQAVNMLQWKAGGAMCKLYTFLNYGTMATHSFILVFLSLFLYFVYKKPDAITSEEYQTVGRKNRFHKWAIPLTWVLGLGLAIPAGALALDTFDTTTNTVTCAVWHGRDGTGSGFYVQLSAVIVGFFIPLLVLLFPVGALGLQLLGSREPRLQPPHSRTGWTAVLLFLVFVATRGPAEVYALMKLASGSGGFRPSDRWNTAYATGGFQTDVTINCFIYVAVLVHPLIYFALNPDYRTGVRACWKNLACNKDPATRAREEEERRQRKLRQYPAGAKRNRAPMQIRRGQEQLLQQPQPQIMAAGQPGVQYYPYPAAQPGMTQQQQMQFAQQQQQLIPNQQFLDTSFERLSPQLPPVFEFEGLKYIDTARVEPRIGYSPEKTPQKTPEIPRYQNKPFVVPGQPPPIGVAGYVSPSSPLGDIEMVDMSPQSRAATATGSNFEMEHLDSSPGSTLRTRSRMTNNKDDLDESIDILTESPGNKNRRRNVTKESQETSPGTNGNGLLHSSRPTSPSGDPARPSSRASGVEIVITGRTRSRQDLCPDVPRSKFEHSV